jgi:AraC family transcriptional activator of pobA
MGLHIRSTPGGTRVSKVPVYSLYGEVSEAGDDFRLHSETLFSRSSRYRFEIDIHRHDHFLQIVYVTGGQADATLGARSHTLRPPAVVIVPPGTDHGFRFSSSIEGTIVTIVPSALPPSLQGLVRQQFSEPDIVSFEDADEREFMREAFSRSAEEHAHEWAGGKILMESYVSTCLVMIARKRGLQSKSRDLDELRMQRFSDLVASHYRSEKNVAFYAARLDISAAQLGRITRKMIGDSPQRLIIRKIVELAKQELVFSPRSVRDIADDLGFSDVSYFTRFFAREVGCPPGLWRETAAQRISLAGDTNARQTPNLQHPGTS